MALNVGKLVALIEGDDRKYRATARNVRSDAKALKRDASVTLSIDGDDSPLKQAVERVKARTDEVARQEAVVQVDADIAQAQARIRELEGSRGKVDIDVDAEIGKAEAKLRSLQQRRQNLTLGVDVEDGGATAKAARLGRQMGDAAKVGIISSGVGTAFAAAMAGAAAGGPLLIGLAGAFGLTAAAAFQTGKALKAYSDDQKAAETASASAAATAVSNAIAIRNAEESIEDARRAAGRAADDVAEAERRAGEVAVDAAERVADAQRNESRAAEDARRATEAVNDARREAARIMDDLAERVSDYALSEEDAAISVEEARKRLDEVNSNSLSTDLEKRRAANDLAQAEERLRDTQREHARDAQDLAEAQAAGVEGSKQVVSAKEAEQAANDRLADAQRAVADAQQQAERDQVAASKAISDAREREQDADRNVARAVQGLADVQAQQAAAAQASSAKTSKFAQEMAKLSPAGRDFVNTLLSMKDMATRLGAEVQTATLPGFTNLLEASKQLEPVATHGIQVIGDAMSDTADKAADLAKSPGFQADLWSSFDQGADLVRASGDAVVDVTRDWVHFTAQARPATNGMIELIGDLADGTGDFFDNAVPGMDAYGDILSSVGQIGRDSLGTLGTLLAKLATEGAPFVQQLADTWHHFLDFLEDFSTGFFPSFFGSWNTLLDILDGLMAMLGPIAPALGGIAGAVLPFVTALKLIDKVTFGAVTGQIRGIKAEMDKADSTREKWGAGLSGMIGTVFNPWGLTIGIATGALAMFGQKQQEGQKLTETYRASVKTLTDAIRENNGVINDHVRELAAQEYGGKGVIDSQKTIRQTAQDLGINLDQLTDAFLGNKDAQAAIQGQLDGMKVKWYDVADGLGQAGQDFLYWMGLADEGGFKAEDFSESLGALFNEINSTADATKAMSYEQKVAQDAADDLDADFKTLADTSKDVATRGHAIIDMLRTLSGQSPTYEDAVKRTNDQFRDLVDLFGQSIDKSKGWGDALLNANGSINTTTENGSRLYDTINGIAGTTAAAAQAAYDYAIQQGQDVPAAMAAANDVVTAQHDRLMDLAGSMGISRDAMQELLNKYALTPEQVMTLIGQPGIENAKTQTADYRDKFLNSIPGNKNTTFTVDPTPAYNSVSQFYDWYFQVISNPLPAPSMGSLDNLGLLSGGRAQGGPVKAGETYLVGEEGPELVTMPGNGMVYTASDTADILGALEQSRASVAAATAPRVPAPRGGASTGGAAQAAAQATLSRVAAIERAVASMAGEMAALAKRPVLPTPVRLLVDGREIARANDRGRLLNSRT
ncbi:hypothetical protein [Amycolatopsis thermophila]|uniref:Nucleic acid-binding Zn-ribbon protein n=1 Tax=Amycolatopsis thermophila TaxID=206084 RepID=A0ABU0ERP8_9PSEU|nr:hypothetical protein [Amycolatopsis thermophila]MDQ0377966.1 putative nucleic acid-binding Zn-ribbon protein [Amycolatopsis thermophila]